MITLSLSSHASQSDQRTKKLLDILGVAYATTGKNATEFSAFTLTQVEELHETLSKILNEDRLEPAEAEALRGKLHWYCTFLFGRRPCGQEPRGTTQLGSELREAFTFLRDNALTALPLKITRSIRRTFYISTDGSLAAWVAMSL